MKLILALFLLLHMQLWANPPAQDEWEFNCVESLSTTQFFSGLGVGALSFAGGFFAGIFLADAVVRDDYLANALLTFSIASISAEIGIFGTWKLLCDRNRKRYVAVSIAGEKIGTVLVLGF